MRTLGIALGLGLAASILSAAPSAQDRSLFVEKLYPAMRAAQCHMCHNDNGVASGTRFEFPPDDATPEQIYKFGLGLDKVVNHDDPSTSLLYLKPTNRTKHPGGERIKQGSPEEKLLLEWVNRLAGLTPEEIAAAGDLVAGPSEERHALSVRRLTHSQYNNAVRDLVGELSRPADQFPPEDFIHGFKNQIHGQSTSPLLMEAYSAAAEKVATNAFRGGDQNHLIPCEPSGPADADCFAQFVSAFGRRAFRRPLKANEVSRYTDLALELGREEKDFLAGVRIVVEAMLQSPSFLMRFEYGPGSDYEAYENASRLSFFLWDTIPNEWLLDLAERKELVTAEQVERAARRMLDDPRATASMDEFLSQWLRFDRALKTIRDRAFYPDFNSELASAMTEETRRLFNYIAWNDRDFRELFTADYTFVNADLAKVYGLPAPAEPFDKVSYPADSGRAGILGQGAFLLVTSKPADTSPTERGLFVREHFLCQNVPPPPPGVNAALPPLSDAKPMTNRERLGVHLTGEGCMGCHKLIDPIGLGLEHFDAIGQFRAQYHVLIPPTRDQQQRKIKTETTEYYLDIDPTAEIVGIPQSSFTNPKELGKVLAEDESCQKCVVKQLFRYALGREETLADRPAIDQALERFEQSGFKFRELILSLVSSKPFLGAQS
ncbi:MAG: DUF1592 domain-containing protein [Acidobacteria bacterium]|nr:DUF1592 domain-containing protein [Acidobacteriota bacterium]